MAARGGRSFWASTMAPTTAIQMTLIGPRATSTSISPTLEPTQNIPKRNPERTLSRQRRRQARFSGVSS
jgi:hypothetical protein